MDALFSKYARPFDFIDGMLLTGRFNEFVDEFLEIENERKTWEFYLHKVYDKSYEDFKKSIKTSRQVKMSNEQIETTVKDSKSILNGFIPKDRG